MLRFGTDFLRRPLMAASLAVNIFGMQIAVAEPLQGPNIVEGAAQRCESGEIVLYEADKGEKPEVSPSPCTPPSSPIASARAYLIETARPGDTMTRQGPELAIGRLHPEFVIRLADSIREARAAGLASAGIFSAYRPPIFGVGGFADKFNSLHSYGLAVDMYGIGMPGTAEAKLWHELAAKHGVVCPYGYQSRVEWNHCQPTRLKIVRSQNPLRDTITAAGPLSLEGMFEIGETYIASLEEAAQPITDVSMPAETVHVTASLKANRLQLSTAKVAPVPRGTGKLSMSRVPSLLRTEPTQTTPKHLRQHFRLSGQTGGSSTAGGGPKIVSVEDGRRMLRDSIHDRTKFAGMVVRKK